MSCCVTPQEDWIEHGLITEGRERTIRMAEWLRDQKVYLDIHRGRLLTESFKETEGEDLTIRWAKAMMHIAENIPTPIGPDELIVGKMTGGLGKRSVLYCELKGNALPQLNKASLRKASPFTVTDEDYKIIMEEIYPYWKDKSYAKAYVTALPESTRLFIYGKDKENYSKQQFVLTTSTTARSSLNFSYDYATILKDGIGKYKAEAKKRWEESLSDPATYINEGIFWEATYRVAEAFGVYATRYGEEADRQAVLEKDPKRKKELETIAQNCYWVAENPPETFWQAMQLQWFIIAFARIEQNGGASLGSGRMDQTMLPYYRKDIAEGRLTREQAKELFECYWLNLAQCPNIKLDESAGKMYEGYAHFETVTIGGLDKNGKDATNELSYLILESKRGFPMHYPDLAARVHVGSPEKFLTACAEVVKDGQGFPKFFNDEEIVPLYVAKGANRSQALNYSCSGCAEVRVVGESYVNGCAYMNLGALVEMTMHDGRLKVFDNRQIGLPTGDPRDFKTFDEFFDAMKAQTLNAVKHAIIQQIIADRVKPTKCAAPFCSMLTKVCRDAHTDIHKYIPNSIREPFIDQVGFATMVDSAAAIKKVVFEDKTATMDEVVRAIDANFEGYEPLRQRLLNAPKYGNNDPYADDLGRELDLAVEEYVHAHRGLHGEAFSNRLVPITNHIPAGAVVGATPDGRKAGDYISEGCSAAHGAEHSGPTAILVSNKYVKNEGFSERAARLLNLKLSPALVAGPEGTKRLVSFIRTWCDLRLWHVQFNIINKDTLLNAQKKPEKYKDLIVRVAGYSAYFTELTPKLQDELIERCEHERL